MSYRIRRLEGSEHPFPGSNRQVLVLEENERWAGTLVYTPNESPQDSIHLDVVDVSLGRRRRGYGTKLLEAFVNQPDVGLDRPVEGELNHDPSLQQLMSYEMAARISGRTITLSEQQIPEDLPIRRFLERGGVHLKTLTFRGTGPDIETVFTAST